MAQQSYGECMKLYEKYREKDFFEERLNDVYYENNIKKY